MDYEKLKNELTVDPLGWGYSGMTNEAVAAKGHATDVGRTRLVPVPSSELLAWSAGASPDDRPRYLKLEEAASGHAVETVRAIAKAAVKMIDRDGTMLDLNLPDRAAMVDALVAGTVLSDADKTSLYALATVAISRWEELDLGDVKAGHIQTARA